MKSNLNKRNADITYDDINENSDIIKIAPLSFSQQQMWVIEQMLPGNFAYNLPLAFRLVGNLNVDLFEKCVNQIISRHEILRTTFNLVDNQPQQMIHSDYQLKIKTIYLQDFNNSSLTLENIVSKEIIQPFDISTLPLLKVTLIKLSKEEQILVLNMHHIISDGWSMKILLYELSGFYNNFLDNIKFSLPELPNQYSDYVEWQQRMEWSPSYMEQLDYWTNRLQGDLPNLDLPFDKQRPPIQSPKGSSELFFLSKDLIDKLNSYGIKRGCTLFMTVLAAFQVFLNKYSGIDDIIIGSPVSNRPVLGENLIGNFLNMVALRANISDFPDFGALLKNARKITLEALKNWDLPFEKIVEILKIKRDMSRNPIFQVMLQFLPGFSFTLSGADISNLYFDNGYSQLDFSLHMYQSDDGYYCRFEYDTDLFKKETIKRMISNFQYLLIGLINNPEQKISEISIINPEEKNRLINGWNTTHKRYPDEDLTLAELFEKQVEKTPESIAVIFGESKITYRELNFRANQISNYLKEIGVGPEAIVGICVDRSFELIEGTLGILKAGGAYLPIDPEQPPERIKFIINDAGVRFVLTNKLHKNLFPDKKLLLLDQNWDLFNSYSGSNTFSTVNPQNAAYIIYTSGSTGQPKGVIIEHRSIVNFLFSMKEKPGISENDILLSVTTISFDIAGLELFLPLISGAKIYLSNKVQASDGYLLKKIIDKMNVTVMQATPATWKLLIEAGWERTPGLKMLCGGEAFSREFADELLARGESLWNMYGPTETTVWSAVNKIEKDSSPVLIGFPIANTRFYVVDKFNQLVPIGVPGELLIGGSGLARGYHNRKELTAEKFIPDITKDSEGKLYRTGDLVKYDFEGRLLFLGRLDYQIKIRGFRIETGEIENVLNNHINIKQSLVVAIENNSGDKYLTAYLLINPDGNFSVNEIRNYLKKKLPDYMIPSFFVKLDKFPLTPNGKIDRKKLPFPDQKNYLSVNHSVPRDQLDIQIKSIWEKAFGINNINIDDDFFELGGHSLLAAQIFAQIRKILNKNLPLATLFKASTISGLADVIREYNLKPSWGSLVPIKSNGNKSPLFLIHGAEGNILLYKILANYLDGDWPVYGLQSQGLDGKSPIIDDVREMAQKYIMEIKIIQPEGPYYLGGYCLGGTIAYEIAQQLTAYGDEVSLIAMIETCNIQNKKTKHTLPLKILHKLENIFFQIMNLYISTRKSRVYYFNEKLKVEINRFKVKIDILYSKLFSILKSDKELNYQHLLINKINDNAQNVYSPLAYDGKVILFRPIRYFTGYNDKYLGWKDLITKDLRIIEMPCYPRGSLNEPFVKYLAEKLGEAINEPLEKGDFELSLSYPIL